MITAPPTPRPPSPRLQLAIASQLAALAAEAENFGVVLCTDPAITTRYLEQLQQIDRHAQALRELSVILDSADPQAAIAGVRLGGLRTELEQACAS